MVLFAQTYIWNVRDSPATRNPIQGEVTLLKNDKFKDHTRYAEYCLNLMTETTDQEARSLRRDMAAELLNLAIAIPPSRKSCQSSLLNPGNRKEASTPSRLRTAASGLTWPTFRLCDGGKNAQKNSH
jgi:hypothetical protein